jgi:isopenicillin-N epimerase
VKEHWLLDPSITYLNHGSFGATPRVVLAKQDEYRNRMEREPVRFLARELDPLIDAVREELAGFVGAAPDDLALLPNATAGVNAVLRSLDLDKHDELLVTNHEYVASRNALDHVASLAGAKVVTVDIPFPIASADVIVERVLAAVTLRTRLLLVDHISSQTAVICPIERLIAELNARGIDTLVDGAHAPGQLPLDLAALGAAYYTGNLHKWVCAPKGAAFLYVRRNRRYTIHPVAIGHGYSATRRDRSRFHLEFDWTGTFDPSGWLAVPEALRFVGSLVPGGWTEVMARNHALALRARDLLCDTLQIAKPAPDDLLGAMAALPLPDGNAFTLQHELFEQHAIEVPVIPWPAEPKRLLRISAMLYNELTEYERLASALTSRSVARDL